VLLAGVLAGGCDDRSSVPQSVLDQAATQNSSKTPARPTTQELLTGHRTTLVLTPLPLTMQVPDSWKIEPLRGTPVTLVTGATPTSDISIQLSIRPSIHNDEFESLVTGAKKEMKQKPDTVKKLDIRPLGSGGAKLMERQSQGAPAPYTVYDAHNIPRVTTQSVYKWTLTVFVPHENAFQVYELNFIGLTKQQFDADKDFLNSIVNTLALGSGAGASSGAGVTSGAGAASTSPAPAPPALP
jgi:hypothetical protein